MLCVTILMSILAFCAADMDVFEGPQLARLSSQNFPANATHVVINVRSQQSPLGQGRAQLYGDLDLPERTVKALCRIGEAIASEFEFELRLEVVAELWERGQEAAETSQLARRESW